MLEEVFVPLALGVGASSPGFKVVDKITDEDIVPGRVLSIWDFLAKAPKQSNFRQIVILAWGGYGKTTLLKHIAYICGTRQQQKRYNLSTRRRALNDPRIKKHPPPNYIPVLLVLRKYRELLAQENPLSLPELVALHK